MGNAKAKVTPSLTVKAYRGDAKTLLAFNLPKPATANLAGFTIQCQPPGKDAYFLYNDLQFETPGTHAQDHKEPAYSSINAPIHKFRWLHVPGQNHQGLDPAWGEYTYTVTPRYFDGKGSMQPLDKSQSVALKIEVGPFASGNVALGFTRGYTQSQAFVRHFGLKASIKPKGAELIFDTSQQSGKNAHGDTYTYAEEYGWLGFTARERIFAILNEVVQDKSLSLDVFAYDLNEPDAIQLLLTLAKQGRVRIILDDAALHHDSSGTKAEDQFEAMFKKVAKGNAEIVRGHFGRYAHDKIFIVHDVDSAKKVLTGSTNFSVTGLYVNSNHVLVFDDHTVAAKYAELFEKAWEVLSDGGGQKAFAACDLAASAGFSFSSPETLVTFSPHNASDAAKVLARITDRIAAEQQAKNGSVLFAVMELGATGKSPNPIYTLLNKLHAADDIFTFGISDSPDGISLYKPGNKTGVLVTGKPVKTQLPPPFNQVPSVGMGHQIHHKFVVCGFSGDDPTVFCGSSNLALGGEQANGDNLLMIRDKDVASAFAIEALALVDHFNFLDKYSQQKVKAEKAASSKTKTKKKAPAAPPAEPPALRQQAAASVGWHLSADDAWTKPYYDKNDLHNSDRLLFG